MSDTRTGISEERVAEVLKRIGPEHIEAMEYYFTLDKEQQQECPFSNISDRLEDRSIICEGLCDALLRDEPECSAGIGTDCPYAYCDEKFRSALAQLIEAYRKKEIKE